MTNCPWQKLGVSATKDVLAIALYGYGFVIHHKYNDTFPENTWNKMNNS